MSVVSFYIFTQASFNMRKNFWWMWKSFWDVALTITFMLVIPCAASLSVLGVKSKEDE